MRRLSHILLTLEAIVLVFLTVLGGAVLLGASGHVWTGSWTEWHFFDALTWTVMLLSLVSAWWLLLAYFYRGHRGARRVPAAIWVFAAVVAVLASVEFVFGGERSPIQAFAPGILFVPTFVHLSAEVWLWPPGALATSTGNG